MIIPDHNQRIQEILNRVSALDTEKAALQRELAGLEKQPSIPTDHICPPVQAFSSDQKIEIFLRLFRGRTDVLPKRWDNQKTGKSGYAPVCKNEWVRGICNKPPLKRICSKLETLKPRYSAAGAVLRYIF